MQYVPSQTRPGATFSSLIKHFWVPQNEYIWHPTVVNMDIITRYFVIDSFIAPNYNTFIELVGINRDQIDFYTLYGLIKEEYLNVGPIQTVVIHIKQLSIFNTSSSPAEEDVTINGRSFKEYWAANFMDKTVIFEK
jgi:hypothetical protein